MPRFQFHKDAPSGQDARQSQDLATCKMGPLVSNRDLLLQLIAGIARMSRGPADFSIAMNAIDCET